MSDNNNKISKVKFEKLSELLPLTPFTIIPEYLNKRLSDLYTEEALEHLTDYIYEVFDKDMLDDMDNYINPREMEAYIVLPTDTEFTRQARVEAFNMKYLNVVNIEGLEEEQKHIIRQHFIKVRRQEEKHYEELEYYRNHYYTPGREGKPGKHNLSEDERREHIRQSQKLYDLKRKDKKKIYDHQRYLNLKLATEPLIKKKY